MTEIYHDLCKKCEYNYHCFGNELGRKISNDEISESDNMYLSPENCKDFYPQI